MSSAAGPPSVIGDVFGLGTDLLSFLPVWLRQLVVAVVLVFLAGLLVGWLARKFLPWAGPALARVLAGAVRLVGYVLLLLEYLPARMLWSIRLRPPGFLYAFDNLIVLSVTGAESALQTGLGATRYLAKTPKWMVVVALLLVLGGWNQSRCQAGDSSCQRPIDAWRSTTAEWFRTTFSTEDRKSVV